MADKQEKFKYDKQNEAYGLVFYKPKNEMMGGK